MSAPPRSPTASTSSTTYLEEIDFGLNQYLVVGDEPLLFHTGLRSLFAPIAAAVARVVPLDRPAVGGLRPRRGGRVRLAEPVAGGRARRHRGDERDRLHGLGGAIWPTGRPERSPTTRSSTSVGTGCAGSTPRTSHTAGRPDSSTTRPTRTLFCGDLFSQWGPYPATTTDDIAVTGRRRHPPTHSPRPAPRSCDGSPTWMSRPSPRCTAPPTPATCPAALTSLADQFEDHIAATVGAPV